MKKVILFVILLSNIGFAKAQYVTIPDANFLTYLQQNYASAMNGNQLDTTDNVVVNAQDWIYVNDLNISNLYGIQFFKSIYFLDCNSNQLTNIPLLPNSLKILLCDSNHFTSFSLPLPDSLTIFSCSNNQLTSLPMLPTDLSYLSCSNNQLSTLPTLPNFLNGLFCSKNQLTSLPILPSTLRQLDCSHNQITNISNFPNNLYDIVCNNNNITCFPPFPEPVIADTSFYVLNIKIIPNPFNCLPNYTINMDSTTLTYPLCVEGNSNGCAVFNSIEKFQNQNNDFKICPNPTNSIVNISINAEAIEVKLFDLLGHQLFSTNQKEMDVSSLVDGAYYIQVGNSTQKLFVKH